MALAVSDSSVLIHLGLVERLDLLKIAFEQILIPPAVWTEVVSQGRSAEVVQNIQQAAADGWLQTAEPTNAALRQSLEQELHLGEAAAICLAVERNPNFLLIDEMEGRAVARRLGVHTKGIVGLLLDLKQAGHLGSIKPVLEDLVQSGFYLNSAFISQILAHVNEN